MPSDRFFQSEDQLYVLRRTEDGFLMYTSWPSVHGRQISNHASRTFVSDLLGGVLDEWKNNGFKEVHGSIESTAFGDFFVEAKKPEHCDIDLSKLKGSQTFWF